VAHLTGLDRLELLKLNGTAISEAGLVTLEQLTGLKRLRLKRNNVTDVGAEQFHEASPRISIR
jgi:hypothetical protein